MVGHWWRHHMTLFDAYLAVDWSASAKKAPAKPSRDAIWVGERVVAYGHTPVFEPELYFRTRQACLTHLRNRLRAHRDAGRGSFSRPDAGSSRNALHSPR